MWKAAACATASLLRGDEQGRDAQQVLQPRAEHVRPGTGALACVRAARATWPEIVPASSATQAATCLLELSHPAGFAGQISGQPSCACTWLSTKTQASMSDERRGRMLTLSATGAI
jgi:hypothetical protein